MSTSFDIAQAAYDAVEPDENFEPTLTVDAILESIIVKLDDVDTFDDSYEVHRLSDRQATVGIWVDGHEYSLTLNRED